MDHNNIKHILFATDGSEYSLGAQKVAIDLTKRCHGELHIMSIMLTTQDLEGMGTHHMREEREKEIQARLDKVANAALAEGVPSTTHLVYGEQPQHEIVNTAAEIGADLIVLGRRGTRGLARSMVGHATAYVAGHAPCNVLVVPRAAAVWHKRILLATDGSEHSAAAGETALAVARQCGLPVSVVSATTRSHSDERKAEAKGSVDRKVAKLSKAGISCTGLVAEGRPDEVVIETAISQDADLIIVGSHGRTGLMRLILGSISERILGQAQCPVLVARATG
jgi:nucleotide-binding universal stress UspA family protein